MSSGEKAIQMKRRENIQQPTRIKVSRKVRAKVIVNSWEWIYEK